MWRLRGACRRSDRRKGLVVVGDGGGGLGLTLSISRALEIIWPQLRSRWSSCELSGLVVLWARRAMKHPLARMTAQLSVGFISPLAWSAVQVFWIVSALGSASMSPLAPVSVESMMTDRLRSAWARASGAETACVMILV